MAEKNDLAQLKVFKFDPKVDKEPRFDTFHAPYQGYTILNVLNYIYQHLDPTLSFRYGCGGVGGARCGACPVVVNNSPALSCREPAEKEMTIEPHPKFAVIRDLFIDFDRTQPVTKQLKKRVKITVNPDKCVVCQDCVLICPVKVYEIREKMAVPVDEQSCCGMSCRQCALTCWKQAITITEI